MTEDFQKIAENYATHTGKKLSTIANYAANDGKIFRRFAEGGSCTLKTARKVLLWLSENWPDDLEWPADVPRPTIKKDAA